MPCRPLETAGPATLLAAIVGFVSTYGLASRKESISTTAIAVISTFISASCYGYLATIFASDSSVGAGQSLPLNVLLVPLCVLAILQYFLSTLATVYFLNIVDGKPRVLPSQESHCLDSNDPGCRRRFRRSFLFRQFMARDCHSFSLAC